MNENIQEENQDYMLAIERKINHLEYLSNYLKEYNDVNGGLRAFSLFGAFAIIPFVLPPLFCSLSSYDYNELVTFLGENMKYGHFETLLQSLFLLPIGGAMSLTDYFYNYKRSLKNEDGINEEKEGLKQILVKCREGLELPREDTNLLEQIRKMGKVYYEIGYHYKKYLNYYQKGILRQKLEGLYTEKQIIEMENYFEEKGIVRNRKLN